MTFVMKGFIKSVISLPLQGRLIFLYNKKPRPARDQGKLSIKMINNARSI